MIKERFYRLMVLMLVSVTLSDFINAQVVRHSYRFNNNLSASEPDCGPDLLQAKAGGTCGAGNVQGLFLQDTLPFCGNRRTVYHTNMHWGLMYPNASGSITNTYTINMYVKTTNWGSTQWVRIIDFLPNSGEDRGIYFKKDFLTNGRCLEFWPFGIVGTCPFFNESTYYLLTFTRNGTTGIIDVYVNGTLFKSYNDVSNQFVAVPGSPIYIYRDDEYISCESGEANFAYLSFSNQYANQAAVTATYNNICSISKINTTDFDFSPAAVCGTGQNTTVTYTGNIVPPGSEYIFNWDWDGGNVVSGTGIGPYVVNWNTPGTKNVKLNITGGACVVPVTNTRQIQIGNLNVTATSQPSDCTGNNGTITVTAIGALPPYQYSLDGTTYQASNIFTVAPGQHTVFVKDGSNCTGSTSVAVGTINNINLQTRSDTSVCRGGSVRLTTSGNATRYSWLPAVGLDNPNIKDPLATPAATTDYIVTATIGSCTKKDTVRIVITTPLVVAASSLPSTCTGNNTGSITVTASGGAAPYQFSANGSAYQALNTFSLPPGQYVVDVKDANNCSGSISVTVSSVDDITLQARADTSVCQGQPVKLFTSSTATSFSWQPAAGLDNATSREPVATPSATTDYIVTATSGRCTKKDTVRITIGSPVVVTATATPANCTVNSNGEISVTANGGVLPYQYALNGAAFQASGIFNVGPGVYAVSVKDANNCTGSASVTVSLTNSVSVVTASDTTLCQNQSVKLFTTSNATAFSWQPAVGLDNPNSKDPVATPAMTTSYIITATNGRCITKDTVTVTVIPRVTVQATPDTTVMSGMPFQLSAYSPQLADAPGVSYVWSPSTGLTDPAIANPVAILNSDQTYSIEVRSLQGCRGNATVRIKVLKGPDIYVPTAFTPDNDGINDVLRPVGVGIQVFRFFKVYNRWGTLVFTSNELNRGWDGRVQGAEQSSAIFVWIVEGVTPDGRVISRKGTTVLIR